MEARLQVRLGVEAAGFAKELEFLVVFEDRADQPVVALAIFQHFLIDIEGGLHLSPAVVLTPALVLEDYPREFGATHLRATVARDGPQILGRPVVREVGGEELVEGRREVASILCLQAGDQFDHVVPFRLVPSGPIGISLRLESDGGRLVRPSAVVGVILLEARQASDGLFHVVDDQLVVLHDGRALRRDGVIIASLKILIADERDTLLVRTIAVGDQEVRPGAAEIGLAQAAVLDLGQGGRSLLFQELLDDVIRAGHDDVDALERVPQRGFLARVLEGGQSIVSAGTAPDDVVGGSLLPKELPPIATLLLEMRVQGVDRVDRLLVVQEIVVGWGVSLRLYVEEVATGTEGQQGHAQDSNMFLHFVILLI